MRRFKIRVPCSSANIGPGFDVVGLALSIYLELHVTINPPQTPPKSPAPTPNCIISYTGEGEDEVPISPDANLITRTALYVLKCHSLRDFEAGTTVHIVNPIPLGRGLGSSRAAVVAGEMLGNECV